MKNNIKLKKFNLKKYKVKKEHIDYYNQYGFILFKNIFKVSEMNKLNRSISYFADKNWHNIMNPDRLEFLLAQSFEKFLSKNSIIKNVINIEKAKTTSDLFRKYLKDKRMVNIVSKLIESKVMGLMTHVIFKHAKTKYAAHAWEPHQDNSYPKMKDGYYITTNLFLHNCNKENGCLYIYPKSHKLGLLKNYRRDGYFSKKNNPGNKIKENSYTKKDYVEIHASKGDLLVMNGNTIHGSYGNLSKTKHRHMLSFNYGKLNAKFLPGKTAMRKSLEV